MKVRPFWLRVQNAAQRRAAKWFGKRLFLINPEKPIISFTFDDFPRSAIEVGGSILEQFGMAGTYYASFGLMGQDTPTGEIFRACDIPRLMSRGHELGCHTFHHRPAWETRTIDFIASVRDNATALAEIVPSGRFDALSYPISYPRPKTKRALQSHFRTCRGGGQTINRGLVDLNYLSAFFLEQSRHDLSAITRTIDENTRQCGWLIFATHDICETPTRFGCNAALFSAVVQYASTSGAQVLPVTQAMEALRTTARLPSARGGSDDA